MMEEDFNKEMILSSEDIIKGLHLKIDKATAEVTSLHLKVDNAFAEVESRREVFLEFLEDFCAPHTENRVWSEMLKGGGAYRVSELPPFVHVSIQNLYKIIERLKRRGLVKMIGNRYQAVLPEAFIREKRTQRR